jgi:hypothetical protein
MNQQLPQIALLPARRPQPRKAAFPQQLQNVPRVATIRLLPAHITGADLGGISDPHFMA